MEGAKMQFRKREREKYNEEEKWKSAEERHEKVRCR